MREKIKEFLLNGNILDLAMSDIDTLPEIIPKNEIKELNISNNTFVYLPSSKEMNNIEILKCPSNQIKTIPEYQNLYELNCNGNNILELSVLPKLEKLYVSDNFVRHIPTFPNLKELRCLANPIKTIDFQPKLERIYISTNAITALPILPRLRKIIVHNFHTFMDYHALEDTCNLRSEVIKQKIRYLKYYINVVKMQRRYRRNYYTKILKPFVYKDMNKKIISYLLPFS